MALITKTCQKATHVCHLYHSNVYFTASEERLSFSAAFARYLETQRGEMNY